MEKQTNDQVAVSMLTEMFDVAALSRKNKRSKKTQEIES